MKKKFLEEFKSRSRHHSKLVNFLAPELLKIKNSNILEFGVSEKCMSTELFLHFSKKHNSKLYSVDNIDYSKKFNYLNWNFVHQRDDEFHKIEKVIPKKFSLILLDTIHEAQHVKKILFYYYPKLEVNKCFFIDDISWLPYLRNSDKPRFYNEINNLETFEILLQIYYANQKNFDLEFTFEGTGMCKIKKKNNNNLNSVKKINTRKYSIKNFLRKIL